MRVAIVIQGGNIVDVASDADADVYVFDYDNPVCSDHAAQRFAPWIGKEAVDKMLDLWDEALKENEEFGL